MADVAHSTLTGADLHESKGVAAAAANTVYVANGSGSGAWTPITSSGRWVLISTSNPSAAANVSITGFNSTLYEDYRIVLENVLPSSAGSALYLRTSTNGGSSYDSGASDYSYVTVESASTFAVFRSTNDNKITLTDTSASPGGVIGEVRITDPSRATYIFMQHNLATGIGSNLKLYYGSGVRQATSDVDGVQFLFAAGNIASGQFRLYGLTK